MPEAEADHAVHTEVAAALSRVSFQSYSSLHTTTRWAEEQEVPVGGEAPEPAGGIKSDTPSGRRTLSGRLFGGVSEYCRGVVSGPLAPASSPPKASPVVGAMENCNPIASIASGLSCVRKGEKPAGGCAFGRVTLCRVRP